MAEVIIHRCTLRIVRRGGWSWGGDTRGLVRAATSALPALIERKLAELFPDDADLDISAPLTLRVPVRLGELLALAPLPAAGAQPETAAHAAVSARIGEAFGRALPTAATPAAPEPRADEARPADARDTRAAADDVREEGDAEGRSLLRLLLAWHARGELDTHLAVLDAPALELWLRALQRPPPAAAAATLPPEAIRREVAALRRALRPGIGDRASLLRARLVAAVEVYARLQVAPSDETLVRALEEEFAAPAAVEQGDAAGDDSPPRAGRAHARERTRRAQEAAAPAATAMPPPSRVAEPPRPKFDAEVEVASALPFLLLGPLAQVGYWEALAGALEAAGLEGEAHLFAAALAYKVLAPPARGWRRTTDDDACAAAFARVAEAPSGSELAEFARKSAAHLAPLDSVITHALARGHTPGSPLLLHRAAEAADARSLVLFDTDGLFAVACAGDWKALAPAARHFLDETLLVGAGSADAALLRALDAEGFRFVTEAPPARGESWRELRRTADERWYTNSRDAREAALARHARGLARASEEAALLWRALAAERAGLAPAASGGRLETSLTLAAALGLGALSWELWRAREFPTPLLALERFADLAARVRFTERYVHVRLPLGRRRSDLEEKGMLADVRGVPWLAGRVVQFSGG